MLDSLGKMYEVLDTAGDSATEQARSDSPGMNRLARYAGLFRPLPHQARPMAALALGVAGLALTMGGLGWLGRKSRELAEYGGDDGV